MHVVLSVLADVFDTDIAVAVAIVAVSNGVMFVVAMGLMNLMHTKTVRAISYRIRRTCGVGWACTDHAERRQDRQSGNKGLKSLHLNGPLRV